MNVRKPVSFTRFCERTGFRLTPAQHAFALVAYDGLEPREHARRIFGDVETIPASARAVIAMLKGRDVGGTRMGAWRLVHLSETMTLTTGLAELVFFFYGAPKLRLARVGLRFALDAARKSGAKIVDETADGFTIVRDDGRRVRHECFAASRGGDNTRGVPVGGALLTEACFYLDEATGVANDTAIFSAIVPRLLTGGQIILESTPWSAEAGLLALEFRKNFGNPTTAIAAHCPTLVMRDDPETAATVAREYERDPENARREFGAEFVTDAALAWPDYATGWSEHPGYYEWSADSWVADPGALADDFVLFGFCWGQPSQMRVERQIPVIAYTAKGEPMYGVTSRPGEYEPLPDRPLLRIFRIERWTPDIVRELGMRRVCDQIAGIVRAGTLLSDQASAPYLAALLSERRIGLRSFNLNQTDKHEAATLIRALFRDNQISITGDSPHTEIFRRQLASYRRIAQPGGTYKYTGGAKAAVDDFPAALLTLGVALLEERGTRTSNTHFNIEGAPTRRAIGGRTMLSGR